jgi:hypothetical protein
MMFIKKQISKLKAAAVSARIYKNVDKKSLEYFQNNIQLGRKNLDIALTRCFQNEIKVNHSEEALFGALEFLSFVVRDDKKELLKYESSINDVRKQYGEIAGWACHWAHTCSFWEGVHDTTPERVRGALLKTIMSKDILSKFLEANEATESPYKHVWDA